MNPNDFQKIVHASLWFGDKIVLSQRLKEGYHKGFWSDAGGKVENNESLIRAIRRETYEETGFRIFENDFKFVDCFIYEKRQLKTYLFEVEVDYMWYPKAGFLVCFASNRSD